MDSLNDSSKIYCSKLIPLTYSMLINNIDYLNKNKEQSQFNFLNLEVLSKEFKLDITFELPNKPEKNTECGSTSTSTELNNSVGFISKSYYTSKSTYNFPPKGPIPNCFQCIRCKQKGPNYHTINCKDPIDQSLYLTQKGSETMKQKKEKYPTEYASIETDEGSPYSLVILKRGQKPVVSSSLKAHRFENNIELVYNNRNNKLCTIRIGKNGVINIISASFEDEDLPNKIIKKINETNSLNKSEYSDDTFKINESITYKYLLFYQFNLIPEELKQFGGPVDLNLGLLDRELLNNYITGEYLTDGTTYYYINNYRFNRGDELSKSEHQTNPFVIFNLVSTTTSDFKTNVIIYKKGAVQLKSSYNDKYSPGYKLEYSIVNEIYLFLKNIFNLIFLDTKGKNIKLYSPNLNYKNASENEFNTYDKKNPQVCHNRLNKIRRPVPYSFYGKCPPGMFVDPRGMKRPLDNRYEPCCYNITKSGFMSEKNILNFILNGFPQDSKTRSDYSIDNPDIKSAILIKGTDTIEQRNFPGLRNMSVKDLKIKVNNFFRSMYNL